MRKLLQKWERVSLSVYREHFNVLTISCFSALQINPGSDWPKWVTSDGQLTKILLYTKTEFQLKRIVKLIVIARN